jgi:hypothetical protein
MTHVTKTNGGGSMTCRMVLEATLGVTNTPWRSVIIRPGFRVDWSPDARPYKNETTHVQFVPAVDLIVRF